MKMIDRLGGMYLSCAIPMNLIDKTFKESKTYDLFLYNLDMKADQIKELRRERHINKIINFTTKTLQYKGSRYPSDIVGGVRLEPNFFSNVYEGHIFESFRKDKKPLTDEKHFGIELEMFCALDFNGIARVAKKIGLEPYLTIKRDGSIRPSENEEGHELTLCIPQSQLEKVLAMTEVLLRNINAKVNKSCGLHVHLDMRNTTEVEQEIVYSNLKKGMKLIKKSVHPNRLTNMYCKFSTSKTFHEAKYRNRYRAINCSAIRKYGTIEIRAMQSTTDTNEIYEYVMMLSKIAFTKNDYTRAVSSKKKLIDLYGQSVLSFVERQELKFRQAS